MYALMKRLSSAVRQLAERLARHKGEIARLEGQVSRLQAQLAAARAKRDATGLLLTSFEARAKQEVVAAISPRAGRYGERGSLRQAVQEALRSSSPNWDSTASLSLWLKHKFQLDFIDWKEEKRWVHGTLCSCLTSLVGEGLVERKQEGPGRNASVLWRWAPPAEPFSLDDLRALADENAGMAVAA